MHGFTWTPQRGFSTVDDPHGAGTTTINGVNDFGQLVGFYVDGNGNTDGFLASPAALTPSDYSTTSYWPLRPGTIPGRGGQRHVQRQVQRPGAVPAARSRSTAAGRRTSPR